ncbi:uncharacterized protein RJT20DRAFT_124772 [Scheffersomyces xylosifermentans]|uniref:uncharacterized protein n=1 Tax=Scheffersomyces xylosifermentans TaxID=1304137 RepID=UPI00315D35C6
MKEELKPELLKVEELFGRSGSVVTDADNIIIPKHLLQQVKLMEGVVKNHFMNFGFVEKKQHNLDKVDWYQACLFYNMTEILKLAELILEIGTYSSRDQSTFGLTAIKFLMEEDRKILQEHLIQQPYYGAERLLESHPPVSYASSSVTPLKIYDGEYEDSFKLKSFNLKSTQVADHFIEEDYLLSLKWENSFLEEVVYELATQLKEEDNKLHS